MGIRTILVNGVAGETCAATLGDLLTERDHVGARIATAVNGCFVPERARAALTLHPGDRVEIVSVRQGG